MMLLMDKETLDTYTTYQYARSAAYKVNTKQAIVAQRTGIMATILT